MGNKELSKGRVWGFWFLFVLTQWSPDSLKLCSAWLGESRCNEGLSRLSCGSLWSAEMFIFNEDRRVESVTLMWCALPDSSLFSILLHCRIQFQMKQTLYSLLIILSCNEKAEYKNFFLFQTRESQCTQHAKSILFTSKFSVWNTVCEIQRVGHCFSAHRLVYSLSSQLFASGELNGILKGYFSMFVTHHVKQISHQSLLCN